MSKVKKDELGEFDFNDIDLYALDKETVNTDKMRSYYGKHMVEAERDRDYAKLKSKVFKAELGLKIRRRPEKFGLEKVTDKAVEELVIVKSEKKEKKLIEAEYKAAMYRQALDKLKDRGSAVGSLIKLPPDYIGSKPRRQDKQMQNRLNKKGK